MKLVLLKIGSAEWEYAWEWVASHPINDGLEDPSTATNGKDSWMYMGSYYNGSDKLISEFKHLNHPYTLGLSKLSVEHDTFSLDSFEKEFKL